jgi:CSLREA domain-containing protein
MKRRTDIEARFLLVAAFFSLQLSALTASGATFTVTKTADTNDGICDGDCSLREAVTAANSTPGIDDVQVPAGTYALFSASAPSGQVALHATEALNITGAGRAATSITSSTKTCLLIDGATQPSRV